MISIFQLVWKNEMEETKNEKHLRGLRSSNICQLIHSEIVNYTPGLNNINYSEIEGRLYHNITQYTICDKSMNIYIVAQSSILIFV